MYSLINQSKQKLMNGKLKDALSQRFPNALSWWPSASSTMVQEPIKARKLQNKMAHNLEVTSRTNLCAPFTIDCVALYSPNCVLRYADVIQFGEFSMTNPKTQGTCEHSLEMTSGSRAILFCSFLALTVPWPTKHWVVTQGWLWPTDWEMLH